MRCSSAHRPRSGGRASPPHTGNAVPPLPASIMRDMFASFLTPAASSSASLLSSSGSAPAKKAKLDATVLDELDAAAHDFFRRLCGEPHAAGQGEDEPTGGRGHVDQRGGCGGRAQETGPRDAETRRELTGTQLMPRELTDQMELSRWPRRAPSRPRSASAARRRRRGRIKAWPTQRRLAVSCSRTRLCSRQHSVECASL